MNRSTQALLAAVGVGALALTAGAQTYAVVDMGTLGGPVAFGFGVNQQGHSVASAARADANFHGLFFSGTAQELLPLPGDTQCWPMAVSNGDAVAAMSFTLGALVPHGLLWQNGTTTSLGDLSPRALNSLGTIVGWRSVPDAVYGQVDRAAYWSGGIATDLPGLGGSSGYAAGVNDQGRIVGWSFTARDLQVHAVLWQGGVAHDLGTLGGAGSQAYAINASGKVVGLSQNASGLFRAMLVTLDASGNVLTRTDLGSLGGAGTSAAYAINASSQVVGTSISRAVLWNAVTPIDLNSTIGSNTGWVLERAWSISDSGHIVGSGQYLGQPHAFLLVAGCYSNCDGSTALPVLTANDFQCFLNRYAAGDPYANCDGSTVAPVLNANDFQCFLNSFAAGCQ